MNKSNSIQAIKKASRILSNMETTDDLRRYGFSLSDYHIACDIMRELLSVGSSATTIYASAARFFEKCGYEVKPEGIGFRIQN